MSSYILAALFKCRYQGQRRHNRCSSASHFDAEQYQASVRWCCVLLLCHKKSPHRLVFPSRFDVEQIRHKICVNNAETSGWKGRKSIIWMFCLHNIKTCKLCVDKTSTWLNTALFIQTLCCHVDENNSQVKDKRKNNLKNLKHTTELSLPDW